jgi:hypothetical protein
MTGFWNPCCIIDSCSYYKPSKTKEQEQKWSSSNVPDSALQDGLTILNHVVCLTQPPVQKPSSWSPYKWIYWISTTMCDMVFHRGYSEQHLRRERRKMTLSTHPQASGA